MQQDEQAVFDGTVASLISGIPIHNYSYKTTNKHSESAREDDFNFTWAHFIVGLLLIPAIPCFAFFMVALCLGHLEWIFPTYLLYECHIPKCLYYDFYYLYRQQLLEPFL